MFMNIDENDREDNAALSMKDVKSYLKSNLEASIKLCTDSDGKYFKVELELEDEVISECSVYVL